MRSRSLHFRFTGFLLVFVWFAGVSWAQEVREVGEEAVEEGPVFTAIALSDLPHENIYYRKGEEFIRIEMRNGRRSRPCSLAGAELLEVFVDDLGSELGYRIIGRAPLVSGTRSMLYFIRQARAEENVPFPLVLYGIDDSEAAFPRSSFRFINFIKEPLLLEFNGKRFSAKPGGVAVRKLELSEAGSFTPFIVRDSRGRVLGGTRLFSHASNREMALIFPPREGRKRLDIRYFSD